MPEIKQVEREDIDDLAFLGREFMTWLVWRVEQGGESFGAGDEAFSLGFGSRVRVGAMAGDVTDAILRGSPAAQSVMTMAGVGAGGTIREAELRIARGEREWRFTLLADTLDLRSVKLPEVLTDEDDDPFQERIALLQELDFMVQTAFAEFIKERLRPAWTRSTVPALRAWIAEALEVASR